MKKYIIYAGANGVGKSTLYNTFANKKPIPRVNSDEILKEIGDWKNSSDIIKAGKIAVQKIEEYFSEDISFNQETTLCGRLIFKNIERAKQQGYIVEMYYVGVESVDIAKERIVNRVSKGGHGIPDEDVERRFVESVQNLKKAISMCDLVVLYDNTEALRRFGIYKNGELFLLSNNVPSWFENILKTK